MSDEEVKRTTSIDFDTPPDQQEIRVLFVVKYVNKNKQVAQYLTKRGWPSEVVSTIPELIGKMSSLVPHFVLISVNHPNKKIQKLPSLLSQTFNTRCIMFAEEMTSPAMRKLQTMQNIEVWKNSVSGPSAQRSLIQAILKMQKGEDDATQKSISSSADNGPDRIEIKGKARSQEELTQELMRLMQDDDTVVGSSSSEDMQSNYSSGAGANATENNLGEQTSLKKQNKNSKTSSANRMSSNLNHSENSISEENANNLNGISGSENTKSASGQSSQGQTNESKSSAIESSKTSTGENQGIGASGVNEGSAPTSQHNTMSDNNSGLTDGSGQGTEDSVGHISSEATSTSENQPDKSETKNNKGVIIEEGADSLAHSTMQKGADNLAHSKKQDGAEKLSQKNKTASPTQAQNHQANTNNQASNANNKKPAVHEKGTADILSESSPNPVEKQYDEEQFNKDSAELKARAQEKLEQKQEDLKQFYKIVETSFSQVCNVPREKFYSSAETNNIANININSESFSGHLVISFAKHNFDEVMLNDLRTNLIREAQDAGLEIDVDHPFALRVKLVNHLDFTDSKSTFCLKGINADEEVTVSFLENDKMPERQLESFEDKLKVNLLSFCVNYSVNFTVYMYLVRNKKFYMYLKEGNTLQQKQLEKLIKSNIDELYIKKIDSDNFKEYASGVYINNLIYEHLESKEKSKVAA